MGFYGAARGVAAFLNLGAFICILLICISNPVVKSFCLFSANFVDGTVVRAGIWGYTVNSPNGTETSTGAKLGYVLDGAPFPGRLHQNIENGVVNDELIGKPLTIAFILWPLACAQTFLAFLGALSNWRPLSLLAVLQTGGAFVLVLAVWIVTCNVAVPAKNRMQQQFPPDTGHVGNVIWLGLAALIALFISQIAMFAGHVPSKEERLKKRVNGKPGKRAPFGNVNWSDESLPREYVPPSSRGADRKSVTKNSRLAEDQYSEEGYPMEEKSDRGGKRGSVNKLGGGGGGKREQSDFGSERGFGGRSKAGPSRFGDEEGYA